MVHSAHFLEHVPCPAHTNGSDCGSFHSHNLTLFVRFVSPQH
jgi:Ulp1 family protease